MIKAMVIAPYPGLAETVKQLRQQETELTIDIGIGNLEEGLKLARQAEKDGYDLIISRGGTASLIEEEVSIPVIHIDVTGYDMLRVFTLVRGMEAGVAMVGFPNISQGAATICNILEYDIKMITIGSSEEVNSHLQALKRAGYAVVMGDVVTVQTAEQVGLRGILITSGKEAVLAAFNEAKRIYRLFSKVKKQTSHLRDAFESLPAAMVMAKPDGEIVSNNRMFSETVLDRELFQSEYILKMLNKTNHQQTEQSAVIESKAHSYFVQTFPIKNDSLVGILLRPSFLSKATEQAIQIKSNPAHIPIIGSSPFAQNVRECVQRYAGLDESIWIAGEKGTGRETVAQAIHFERFGQEAPMIVIDGSRVTEKDLHLLESRASITELKRGTVLLKQTENLQTGAQQMLLQLLHRKPEQISVVVMGDIKTAVERLDNKLFQHLADTTLHLLPLRERRQDISAFVQYFLSEFHANQGSDTLGIKQEAVRTLQQYDWPGNMDQLRLVVRELSMRTNGYYVDPDIIPTVLQTHAGLAAPEGASVIPVQGTLADMEQQIMQKVLAEEGMNQSKAAKRLGINRSTLWRKLNH
ncbi:sigma-54-dependent Fis family transcriptional regulator [Sediminibacillus dalangtanensis]|uniref:Sigma-54-dependent Fis family transcriptional regulator n=1 Tax=Sediminibacillus dalangtanensis TaxID=2729421 RepID=A0ABX7VYR9_9BACI|nr:sigma-54-dependent transcriptional regulator [Sediminibacillus dalangtanensis]QTN00799.1 sigma-54-dependent Fis family transcriptional regulator [Sediminibacillus dalangtanensis]